MRYLIGTRGSKLALVQTDYVIDKLKRAYPDDDFKAVIIKTTGDIEQKKALDKIGSKGIFVKEIEDELLSGKIHMAVHSMKDMPDEPAAGLTFAKAWKREDPRDVLVLKNAASLDELPQGAVIGTGSKRRKYQLLKLRPDLNVVGIRGNIDTRLRKLYDGEYRLDGIVLAAAGIKRIGRESEITQFFSEDEMIPAPAQGTLALELRADNTELMQKLDALSDKETDLCANVERDFLKQIGGNCHLPVAAHCDIVSEKDSRLKLLAMFGSEDGKHLARTEQIWDMTSDRNDIVERAVHDIRYKLENN
ncbi:hydroxymethylbilane synthase [Agathobacter sp.]